jgi:hypothetical protein
MRWAGAQSRSTPSRNRPGEALKQTPAMAEQWVKLGYADTAAAHDIIQNRVHYDIDWTQLIIMAAVVIGYFVFLFRASDKEYREVIDEKFNGK